MTAKKIIQYRHIQPSDHQRVIAVMPQWWNGRDLSSSVHKVFFYHFSTTSFIAEKNNELVGFLIGFLSQTRLDEGYIHFAGVHPNLRRKGVGRALYTRFFDICRAQSRSIVRSCTSPVNTLSIGFHNRMGFVIEPGDAMVNDEDLILFKKDLYGDSTL